MIQLAAFFLFLFTQAQAQSPTTGTDSYGLGLEAQFGYPTVNLTNPDGSKAYYDGLAVRGNLDIPIIDLPKLEVLALPGVKYLDLKNTANSGSQSEVANIIGPGMGMAIRFDRFWLGAQYFQLWGRHYSTGKFSNHVEYRFSTMEYFGGVHFKFGKLGAGLNYSASSGTIPTDKTGLSSGTPYNENLIMLQITVDTGASLLTILKTLF